MTKIQYPNFRVESCIELPVTEENYFKHDIVIYPKECEHGERIYRSELFMSQTQGLVSGDAEQAESALRSIIFNREEALHNLKKAL